MRHIMLFLTCITAAVMLGCVPSLQPLYSDKDPILLPALAGTWASEDGKDTFTFKADDQDRKYDITCVSEKGTGRIEGRLLRLGQQLFLDTTVNDLPDTKSDYAKFHLLPVHLFTKISVEGDVLKYATLNIEWIKKGIDQNKLTIRHETTKDLIVLTASTPELQEFIRAHADDKDAFQETKVLRRQK